MLWLPALPPRKSRLRRATIFGLVVLFVAVGLGAGALMEASQSGVGTRATALALAASLLGLCGVLWLTPVLLRPFLWVFAAIFQRLHRLPPHFALRNLRRYPRRTSLGAAALVIGIAIATTGGILADSARKSLQAGVVSEVHSDLVVASLQPSTNVEKALAALRKVDGVRFANANIFSTPMLVRLEQDPTRSLTAAGITADEAKNLVSLQVKAGDVEGLANGQALVNARDAAREGWKVGDAITVTGPRGIYSTKVAGIVRSTLLDAAIFLDPQYLRQAAAPETLTYQYIFVNLQSDKATPTPAEIRQVKTRSITASTRSLYTGSLPGGAVPRSVANHHTSAVADVCAARAINRHRHFGDCEHFGAGDGRTAPEFCPAAGAGANPAGSAGFAAVGGIFPGAAGSGAGVDFRAGYRHAVALAAA